MSHGTDPKEMFEVSCKVVLLNPAKTKVLILVFADGRYALPGGHLEHGEKPIEAMCREISEEIGIDYEDDLAEIGFGIKYHPGDGNPKAFEKIILGFVGVLDETTAINHTPDEGKDTQLKWLSLNEAIEPSHYYFDGGGDIYLDLVKKAIEVMR